ncbi:MAG: hypothetical protein GY801_29190 [bacterium]|nr:hypothetical protein [bacterium]
MRTAFRKQASGDVLRKRPLSVNHRHSQFPKPDLVVPSSVPVIQQQAICPCGGGCPRCTRVIQPKLPIGQPDDKYEREADRVAEQVMRIPEPGIQRKPT